MHFLKKSLKKLQNHSKIIGATFLGLLNSLFNSFFPLLSYRLYTHRGRDLSMMAIFIFSLLFSGTNHYHPLFLSHFTSHARPGLPRHVSMWWNNAIHSFNRGFPIYNPLSSLPLTLFTHRHIPPLSFVVCNWVSLFLITFQIYL